MKSKICLFMLSVSAIWPLAADEARDTLYQVSTIDALMAGVYDGPVTCGELLKRGDTGIGTFQGLDGELICLDGVIYQASSDGRVSVAPANLHTPFATITYFETDQKTAPLSATSLEDLSRQLDRILPSSNTFYVVRLDGRFDYVKTRSVPKQERPYPPLTDGVKHQTVFEFKAVEGILLAFRCPAFVKGVNVPGYHFHFLTQNRKGGGHALDVRFQDIEARIDRTDSFFLYLPPGGDFDGFQWHPDSEKDLKAVEQQPAGAAEKTPLRP